MKKACTLALLTLLVLSGCESVLKPSYDLSVRNNSFTSDTLFRRVHAAVIRVDESEHPESSQRSLERIEAIYQLSEAEMGVERWTIRHDEKNYVPYLVKLMPNGIGYVHITISPDKGSIPPRINPLLPAKARTENPDNLPKAK